VRKILVTDGEPIGRGDAALLAAASLGANDVEPRLSDGALIEEVTGAPRLVVFGGGHVGARVAEAAAFAGWRVTVVDDRPDYADPARLPFAERAVVCDFHDLPSALGLDAATYAVVATRGHQHDAVIVDQLARIDLRYLGMLGSRRKVALTWKLLERWGVPPERLARVHAPVGLALGADTPAEIAISVVAEMIAERRSGSRRRTGDALVASERSESGE
jgi:xanthine dehydrogenase accessory factor